MCSMVSKAEVKSSNTRMTSPKIREALKFVQRFTQKSYNFQGVSQRIRETWHLCIMHFFQKLFHILAIFFTHVCIKDHQWVCTEVKAIYSKSGTSFLVLAVNEDFAKTFNFYSSSEILAIILHTITIVHCFSALQTLEHPDMLLFRWGINLTTSKSWWSYTTFYNYIPNLSAFVSCIQWNLLKTF